MGRLTDSLRSAAKVRIEKPVFEEMDLGSLPDSLPEAWALIDEINAEAQKAESLLGKVDSDLANLELGELFAKADEIMSHPIYQD